MAEGWTWDEKTARYRDPSTGRFLSHKQVVSLRDQLTDARQDTVGDLVRSLLPANPTTDETAWTSGVRIISERGWKQVQDSMIAQYVSGRGGIHAMTDVDRAVLNQMLRDQKQYWDGFMRSAMNGDVKSRDGVAARANLYNDASTTFFEAGRERALGIQLPALPGDGGTSCAARCRCSWQITVKKDRVEATWTLGGSIQPCADCVSRSGQWAPYVIERAA